MNTVYPRHKYFLSRLPKFCILFHRHFQTLPCLSNNGLIDDFFDHLLQHCINTNQSYNLEQPLRQVHARIILTSSLSSFLSARLISAYTKFTLLADARKVFDTSPEDCFFATLFWNSMLRAYVSCSRHENAIELYGRMRELGIHPDGFGFPLILRACAMRGDAKLCELVHSHVVQTGFLNNLHVCNELMGMYGEIGRMEIASQVFDNMRSRTRVSWNIMISGYTKNLNCNSSFEMFCKMKNDGWDPNSVTWTSLISGFARCGLNDRTWEFYIIMRRKCVEIAAESMAVVLSICTGEVTKGEIIHAHGITAGFEKYVFVRNALLTMYGKNGCPEKAEYLFSQLESKSIVSWNALISAYTQSGLCDEALSLFLKLEFSDENSTVRPNVVTWTALVNGFAVNERHTETLELFRHMQFARIKANNVTLAAVLTACAELSALPLGQEMHAHTIKNSINSEILVTNGLINMYMKSGSLKIAGAIFEAMACRDITSWNIMITGYGMHGFGNRALNIFHKMLNLQIKPDEVTFVAVLSACSHSGLVAQGREMFNQMTEKFRIEPRVEHYACMVDILGRAGLLIEASEVIKSMPMEPNTPVWGALLNSCRMHNNTDIAEDTAVRFFDLGDFITTGSYMLMSDLYAASGRWNDSAKVRLSAKTKGLKKTPGQSWIEVNKKWNSFRAGNDLNGLDIEKLHGLIKDYNFEIAMDEHVLESIF